VNEALPRRRRAEGGHEGDEGKEGDEEREASLPVSLNESEEAAASGMCLIVLLPFRQKEREETAELLCPLEAAKDGRGVCATEGAVGAVGKAECVRDASL
jgi:hypothetical protein